jgi:hypothetical protein
MLARQRRKHLGEFMIRGTAVLFVLLLADVAYADCSILGQQAKQADTRLESAMQRYKAAAAELPRSVDRSTKYSDALAASGVNRRPIGTPDRHPKGTPSSYVSND